MASHPLLLFARFAPAFSITLGLLSLVDFCLAAVYGAELAKLPVKPLYVNGRDNTHLDLQIAFYVGFVPLTSMIWGIVEGLVFLKTRSFSREVVSLIGSVALFVGWLVNISFWTNCEEIDPVDGGGGQEFCPQSVLGDEYWVTLRYGRQGSNSSAQDAKYALGWVVCIGYLAYMIFISVIVSKAKIAERHARIIHDTAIELVEDVQIRGKQDSMVV